jgi:GLPGLI family protein
MKYLILILGIAVCVAAARVVFAQEGTIYYETKVNMHRGLPPERAEMKEMIPEFNFYQTKLLFNSTESLYVNIEDEPEEEAFGDDGPVQIRMRRPMNEYYNNFAQGKRVTMQEFLGKNFLVEDSVKVLPWKLSSDVKTILGYECKKATWYNEERKQNVIAWYTEKLPPFLGPEIFNSLPGTIMEVDVNDGERVVTAKNIKLAKLGKGELKVPVKGQKTTEEDFRKFVEEQRRRMGSNGNVIIRN